MSKKWIERTFLGLTSAMLSVAFVVAPFPAQAKTIDCNDPRLSMNDIQFWNPCESECLEPSSGVANSSIEFKLPATKGKSGLEEAINSSGQIPSGGSVTFSKHASKGQEYQDYYITMRWDYVDWKWNGTTGSYFDDAYYKWMNDEPRIVHVTNSRTGKSIYAVALEAGPAPWTGVDTNPGGSPKQGWSDPQRGTPDDYTGRVSGFPPVAWDYLDIQQGMFDGSGDILEYAWAPDQSVKPGPAGTSASSNADCDEGLGGGFDLDGMTFFDQCDPRWENQPYGKGSMCQCACGPTSAAMIIATLNNDKSISPVAIAKEYYEMGGQYKDCGSWHKWGPLFSRYNLNTTELGNDMNKARDIINKGGLVLFSWNGAPFTGGGHIMVIRGFTDDGNVLIASSGGEINKKQSEVPWDIDIFKNGWNGRVPAGVQIKVGEGEGLNGMWGVTK